MLDCCFRLLTNVVTFQAPRSGLNFRPSLVCVPRVDTMFSLRVRSVLSLDGAIQQGTPLGGK